MLVFEQPAMLLLLLVVPPLVYLKHFWRGRGGTVSFAFALWGAKDFSPPRTAASVFLALAGVLFWTGVIVFVLALAGPQRVSREQSYLTRGVDIIFVLDQSPTMAARDFHPGNRFEAAREMIRRFVMLRENDPVGIVGFGLEASLRVPPTLDYGYFLSVLDRMEIWEMGDGTAIGMGLAVAALHLERSNAPRRAIVLLTDGVNNAGEIQPETAARAARSLGIGLYIIGLGSNEEVEIELRDPETGQLLRGRVQESFDEAALLTLAGIGGGRYFSVRSSTALQSVFDTIDTVERVEQRSLLRVVREPLDRLFILAGIVLIAVDFFIRRLLFREVL